MSDLVMKFQILTRTELALAQIRARRTSERLGLVMVVVVVALIALGMINLSAFYALSQWQGPALAALIVAGIDMAAAAVVLMIAQKWRSREAEERLAQQMRQLVTAEINEDIAQVKADIAQISEDVRAVRSGVHALSGLAGTTIIPVLKMLTRASKKG